MPRPPTSPAQHIHFLLLPEFSVMGFVSAIEPLRVANRFRAGSYEWHILSADGGPVVASNGMSINAEAAYEDAREVRMLFVVAGFHPLTHHQPALARWLRGWQREGATLGALDTGVFVLAASQLLGTHPVTVHWEARAALMESYPRLRVTEELFEIGPQSITCAGGTAAIDMMLALIAQAHGRELAAAVSEQFVLGRIRSQSDHQRMEIAARHGLNNRKVIQVIRLMQQNIEEPLVVDVLAQKVTVTRRQLERLFAAHLQATPSLFYLGVRLDRARELLRQSDMAIMDIGVACGFRASSHFSRSYRARFGRSPKDDRAASLSPPAPPHGREGARSMG